MRATRSPSPGTYDNSGDTLYVGAGTTLGTINLAAGLPISGGTIVDSGGGVIYAGGTLDGVTYVGTLTLGASAALDVADGLVVQTTGSASGIVNLTGRLLADQFPQCADARRRHHHHGRRQPVHRQPV